MLESHWGLTGGYFACPVFWLIEVELYVAVSPPVMPINTHVSICSELFFELIRTLHLMFALQSQTYHNLKTVNISQEQESIVK